MLLTRILNIVCNQWISRHTLKLSFPVTLLSRGTFPSGAPLQSHTTPPPHPTQDYLSSPVKPVVQSFAAHKHKEVQKYGYDKSLHQLKDYEIPEVFLKFLGVSEDVLKANTKPIGKDSTTASGQPEGSGESSRESKGKHTGMAIEVSTNFSRTSFVLVVNTLARSILCTTNI